MKVTKMDDEGEAPGFCVRADLEQNDVDEIYACYPTLFSLRMHHGGKFSLSLGRIYIGGKVNYIDLLDTDRFLVHEIDLAMVLLDYKKGSIIYYHYLIPGQSLDFSLRGLAGDKDVIDFVKLLTDHQHKIIDFYTEHGSTSVPSYLQPHPVVVIEELHDPDVVSNLHNVSTSSRILELGWYESFEVGQSSIGKQIERQEDVMISDYYHDHSDGGAENQGMLKIELRNEAENEVRNEAENVVMNEVENEVMNEAGNEVMNEAKNEVSSDEEGSADEASVEEDSVEEDIDEEDSYDSDFVVDLENNMDDVELEVDMREFRMNTDNDVGDTIENNMDDVDLEVLDNDAFESLSEEEENVVSIRKQRLKYMRKENEKGSNFYLGYMFGTKDEVKRQIKTHAVESRRVIKIVKDDTRRVRAICQGDLPSFDSQDGKGKEKLKSKEKVLKSKGPESKYPWVPYVSKDDKNPNIVVKVVQEQFQRRYELGISRMKAYMAKVKAKRHVRGDYRKQYALLRDYVNEIHATNPGTIVKLEVEPVRDPNITTRVFKRIYVCLGALKQGFKAIGRDLLGLDGASMKDDLDLGRNSNFTFISDRQKGILPAIQNLFPLAEHILCLRHIHENMKLTFKGKLYKDMLWKAATCTTIVQFQQAMDDLKAFNSDAHLWLTKISPQSWTRSHFTGRAMSDVLLNNMCEVFNGKIVDARDKPIITCLEFIREYLMKRIVTILKIQEKSDGSTPTARKILETLKKDATYYTVMWNGEDQYQVTRPKGSQYVVHMNRRFCTCRRWEITWIPCKHVVVTIWYLTSNGQQVGILESWVHPVYKMETGL